MSIDSTAVRWLTLDRAAAYAQLAAATCTVYDHITTFDLEIELIWRRPKWSMVQFLFLITRYLGNTTQLYAASVLIRHIVANTQEQCQIFPFIQRILLGVTMSTMQAIMMYRVSSMYNHSRKIIILLVVAFVVEMAIAIMVNILTMFYGTPYKDPAPGVHLCMQAMSFDWVFVAWIPIGLFELLILGLSISVAIKYYDTIKIRRRHSSYSPNSLAFILLRDSISFPFISALGCIVGLILTIKYPGITPQIAVDILGITPNILGCRLILNLRETYYQPFGEEFTHCQSRFSRHNLRELDFPVSANESEYPAPSGR